jgi:ABC-type amino acid transport substrate-binding protein
MPLVTTELDRAGVAYEETTDPRDSIEKLDLGRVDFVIEDRAVMCATLKAVFPDRLGPSGPLRKDNLPLI